MPRERLKPTDDERRHVKSLAAYGISPKNIAGYLHVSEKTLLKYYREEIFRGPLEANAKVGKALLEMATTGGKPAASIHWLKIRGGWRENQDSENRPAAAPDFIVVLDKKAA